MHIWKDYLITEADNLKKTISKSIPADLHCADAV